MFPKVDRMFPKVDRMFPKVDRMFPKVDRMFPQIDDIGDATAYFGHIGWFEIWNLDYETLL
jgi:hypothetical protein